MNTTLNEIRKKHPCTSGWNMLLKSLDKTQADDELVSFKYILESNGINDAVWCLRVLDYKKVCLFCADVAELVLPIFENRYPDDKRPREAIEGIRKFHANEIKLDDLELLREAAAAAAAYADAADADAADAADAAAAAADAAYAAYADAIKAQWEKTEALFIKYFC